MRWRALMTLLAVLALASCAGVRQAGDADARPTDADAAPDTGLADTGLADTGLADTGLADTAPRQTEGLGAELRATAPTLPVAGLWPTSAHEDGDPDGQAHYAETIVVGDLAVNANSFAGYTIYRGIEDRLRPVLDRPEPWPAVVPRCTTLAFHASTATLFCASADPFQERGSRYEGAWITVWGLSDPEEPTLRQILPAPETGFVAVADAEVLGNELLLAAFDDGIYHAAIASDGTLSMPTRTLAGNFVGVVAGEDRSYALEAERGVFVLDASLGVMTTTAPLPGAPLDLHVDAGRVAVALGSRGARIYRDLGTRLEEEATLTPRCSVTSVALRGDVLAVGCASGVLLYDLRREVPRVAGFERARATILDVAFVGDGLVVLDWNWIWRCDVDIDGEALNPDISGIRLAPPAAPVTVGLRSHGELPLVLDLWLSRNEGIDDIALWRTVDLPPGEDLGVLVTSEDLATAGLVDAEEVYVIARSRQLEAWRSAWGIEPDLRRFASLPRSHILRRVAGDLPGHHPAIGERFPDLGLHDVAATELRWGAAGARRVSFTIEDCAAMWHELRDLAARTREGEFGEVPPLVVTPTFGTAFVQRHLLGDLRVTAMGPGTLYPPTGVATDYGQDLYEVAFLTRRATYGAFWTTGYDLDGEGRVVEMDRVYRGAYPL